IGGIVFLVMRPEMQGARTGADLSTVIFASAVVAPLAWGALAVWAPSWTHLGLFASWAALTAGSAEFGFQWVRGTFVGGQPLVDLPAGLGAVALAAVLVSAPARDGRAARTGPPKRLRPVLTVSAVTAACATLAVAA